MKKFGIDISKWQKGFNFNKAKAEGVEFAILRGAYHMTKDTCFEGFYKACKARNIPVGVYHYSMAKTVEDAKAEACFLLEKVLKGKQFEYPIYMDVEDKTQTALDDDLLTDIIVAFCETLENAGYYVGIYSTANLLKTETNEGRLTPYDKWIAHWSKGCTYTGDYGMWQFGGETNLIRSNKVAGVVCDQDYAMKDYPTIIKQAGLNGYSAKTPSQKKTAATVTTEPAQSYSKSKAGTYKVNASGGLRLRSGASTSKTIIETMTNGSKVHCYGYYTGQWLFVVSASGKQGFCHKSLLKKA